jgi:hypothetical protein
MTVYNIINFVEKKFPVIFDFAIWCNFACKLRLV